MFTDYIHSPMKDLKKPKDIMAVHTSKPEDVYIMQDTSESHYDDVFADDELFEMSML